MCQQCKDGGLSEYCQDGGRPISDGGLQMCEFCHWLMQQCTCDKQLLTEITQLRAENAVLTAQLTALQKTGIFRKTGQ